MVAIINDNNPIASGIQNTAFQVVTATLHICEEFEGIIYLFV